MVLSYYGLRESPFGVTPDPRYLFASGTHREALASILYGVDSGVGFITLTALPGMGKTTLLFEALGTIKRKALTAFLFQTITTPSDLLKALLADLGVAKPEGGMMELQSQLNDLLATYSAEGKKIVVVIDEAQNLDNDVLEMVRMLSNFESSREKFMQIILSGQPQLAKRLSDPQLLQLKQRISISAKLAPLSATDVAAYIQHRLSVAGYSGDKPLFTAKAVDLIAQNSGGIPRNINNLCFNALSIGCAVKTQRIGPDIIQEVITDLDLEPLASETLTSAPASNSSSSRPAPRRSADSSSAIKVGGAAVAVLAVAALGYWGLTRKDAGTHPVSAAAVPAQPRPVAAASVASTSRAPAPEASAPVVPASEVSAPNVSVPVTSTPDAASSAPATSSAVSAAASVPVTNTMLENLHGRWITALRGQTLHRICTENFGVCEPSLFQTILKANPSIPNPNRIQQGQRIFLPDLPTSASRLKQMNARLNGAGGHAQDSQ